MTVVEVLVAAAILLFAATALLSLAIGAMTAARVAQERANVVNATASYMESIRGRRYSLIGTGSSGDPTGTVVATTTVAGAYKIEMTPTIKWVDDPAIPGTQDYKRVRVDARAYLMGSGGEVMTYTVESIVSSAGAR